MRQLVVVVVTGVVLGYALSIAASRYRYRRIAADGDVEFIPQSSDIASHLLVPVTIGSQSVPAIVDTGWSGDMVYNMTCIYIDGYGAEQIDEILSVEGRSSELSDRDISKMSGNEIAVGGGSSKELVATANGLYEMSSQVAHAKIVMNAPDGSEVVSEEARLSVQYIENATCIIPMDFLLRHRPVTIDMDELTLRFSSQSHVATRRPRQRSRGGVVEFEIVIGTHDTNLPLWVTVDTGYVGSVVVPHHAGQQLKELLGSSCCAKYERSADSVGNSMCSHVIQTGAYLQVDDQLLGICPIADHFPVLVNENSTAETGLMGLAALRNFNLHIDLTFTGSPEIYVSNVKPRVQDGTCSSYVAQLETEPCSSTTCEATCKV